MNTLCASCQVQDHSGMILPMQEQHEYSEINTLCASCQHEESALIAALSTGGPM